MPGTYHAVLIGNSDFPEEPGLPPLRCPLNDVRGMAELLQSEQHGPYEVSLLENADHHIIHREIYRALKRADRDDRVLIYYAGHGKINDDDGSLYLASRDTVIEDLPASSVAIADVTKYMNNSASKQLILILDCCYSGAVDKLLSGSIHRGDAADQIASNFRGTGGSGSYVLTASTSLQRAEEREGDHHGLLTKHLLAGIREGKADRDDDGFVSMHELTLYVQDQVRAEGKQTPLCYTLREEDGGLVIARTGKAARSRKLAEVQDEIYAAASAHRASLRTVRCALSLLVPDPGAPPEDKAICTQFVDQIHAARLDSHSFTEILEDAPILLARLAGPFSALQHTLEQERDEARLDAHQARESLLEQTRLRQEADVELLSQRESFGEACKRIDELSATAEQLSHDLAAQTKKLAEDRRRAKEHDTELHEVRNSLADAGRQLQDTTEALEGLTKERDDLQQKLAAEAPRRERFATTLQKTRKQLTAEKQAREAADAEIQKIRKQIAASASPKEQIWRPTPAIRTALQKSAPTEQVVLAILQKFGPASDFYISPKIPVDKLLNAREKCGVDSGRKILALLDCTLFGSAKDCVLFDAQAIHWHDASGKGTLLYTDINSSSISAEGVTNLNAGGRKISIAGTSFEIAKLVTIVKELVALSR